MENLNISYKDVLFKEGEKATRLFLVKSGEILCLKSSKDRLIPIFLAKDGDIIGESALIHDSNYSYSAISLGSSELVIVTSFSFKQVFNKAPDWILDLTKTMITRFQTTSDLISTNRLMHPSIIEEGRYTPEIETEFKKLVSQ